MLKGLSRFFRLDSSQTSPVFVFSVAIMFWTIFDNILLYITPLLMHNMGFSASLTGLIIGTSSVAGALFDFIICKMFSNTNFRRVFLIMFAICFIYPLILWQAKSVWMFLIAMSIWGIYYDLYGFGLFNFVGKYIKRANHSASFGIVMFFRTLGSIIAPFIVGLIIVDMIDWRVFAFSWIFLLIGFLFFITFLVVVRKRKTVDGFAPTRPRRKNMFIELHLWKKLGGLMLPVLALTFYLFFIDAFFWTLAPLYAETINLEEFGGLFLAAYMVPQLLVGWFASPIAERFGKKRTAFTSLFIGSAIMSLFLVVSNPAILILVVFVASCFTSLAFPIIGASYADYIADAPQVEGEIEGIEDFACNIGYVFGPILAGVLADILNVKAAFGVLGLIGAVLAVILLIKAPKHIVLKAKPSEL